MATIASPFPDVHMTGSGRSFLGVLSAIAGTPCFARLIPADTMLIGLAQEHGCTYEKL